MPFSDPATQAEFNRENYLRRYQEDQEFREAEAFRKKEWYDRNRRKILARYREKRKKLRASLRRVKAAPKIRRPTATLSGFRLNDNSLAIVVDSAVLLSGQGKRRLMTGVILR